MEKHKWINNLILLIIMTILVGGIFIWIFYQTKQEESYVISVIVGEADNERWAVLQQGLEKAANDFNAQINFYTLSDVRNMEEQKALVQRELDKQVDAIIVDAVDSKEMTEILQKNNEMTQIILLETDLAPGLLYPQVLPDNYQIGKDLGESLRADNVKQIGILMENDKTVACEERLNGLKEVIAEDGSIQIEWIVSNQNRIAKASWYFSNTKIDAIVALDCISTKEAVSVVENHILETKVYGVGNTESNIYYLDKEKIQALLIPNEYNMGYFALQMAIRKITKQPVEEIITVDHIVVTKENLYSEENQRLVFPFVQ